MTADCLANLQIRVRQYTEAVQPLGEASDAACYHAKQLGPAVPELLAALAAAEQDRDRANEHAQQLHDDMEAWHAALGPVLAGTEEEELEEVLGVRAARLVERLRIQNADLFRVRAQLLEFEAAATEAQRRLRRARQAFWDMRCDPPGAERVQAWRDLAAALDETLEVPE